MRETLAATLHRRITFLIARYGDFTDGSNWDLTLDGLHMFVAADVVYNHVLNVSCITYEVSAHDDNGVVYSFIRHNTREPKIEINEAKAEHYNLMLQRHMPLEDLARIAGRTTP